MRFLAMSCCHFLFRGQRQGAIVCDFAVAHGLGQFDQRFSFKDFIGKQLADRFSQQRFSGARRTDQQCAARELPAQTRVALRLFEEVDNLL